MMTFTLKGVALDNMWKLGLVLPLLLGRPPYLPHQDPRAISLFSLNPSWHNVNTKLNDPEKMLLRGILKVELLVLDGGATEHVKQSLKYRKLMIAVRSTL